MASPVAPSTIQFIQAQAFTLSGSGASIGDVTVTLQSMYGIDGNTIVTADLGSFAYGTLEPGNGTQEEAILFTGVTQNANGTATLTGVSSLSFKQPYTLTTGLTKTHAGASKFVLSNDAAFYNNLVLYMNAIAGAGAANASTTVKGIGQAPTTAQINSGTATGSTGAVLFMTPDAYVASTNNQYTASIVGTAIPYAVATGTSTAYTATLASSISSLASGTYLNFLVPTSNATGVTLNINGLGAKSLKKKVNTSLASGDLLAGQVASAVFDGTNYQILNETPQLCTTGLSTKDLTDANATQTIAHGLGVIPKRVNFYSSYTSSTTFNFCAGTYTAGGQNGIWTYYNGSSGVVSAITTQSLKLAGSASNTFLSGTVTVDATNISIAWVKTGSPTGTVDFSWTAEA